jgi:hypothetical protein
VRECRPGQLAALVNALVGILEIGDRRLLMNSPLREVNALQYWQR